MEGQDLVGILDDAGSAYRVNEDADGPEERVTPAVHYVVRQTIADAAASPAAGSGADHVAAAWQAAYGRSPDAVRSYSKRRSRRWSARRTPRYSVSLRHPAAPSAQRP